MINFYESTTKDLEQLGEWTANDTYHSNYNQPDWWLTGNGILAFRLDDTRGPLTYVRLNEEGGYVRIHAQFAPESVVGKRRLVSGMMKCMDCLKELYKLNYKGMIFNSVSPSLIAFMENYQGFKSVGNDDYQLNFEVI